MKICPCCDYANDDAAAVCRRCEAPFASVVPERATLQKTYLVGPQKARAIRSKALSALVLGLLIMVYWGGYGPWPVIDHPTLAALRVWLQPLLIYGGLLLYLVGWVLHRI